MTVPYEDNGFAHLDVAARNRDGTTGLAARVPLVAPVDPDWSYETVAASQTDQVLGSTGAAGDYLSHLLVVPATLSPGEISIENGATNIIVFTGGASSILTLHPFTIDIRAPSVGAGWEVTTGANVSVIAVGRFT